MSDEIKCDLDGCEVMFKPYRKANIYHSDKCRKAAHLQKWFRKVPRRVARKAKVCDTGQFEASERLKSSTGSTRTVKVASVAAGLEVLARQSPAFFLRLLASVERDSHHYIAANSAQVAA